MSCKLTSELLDRLPVALVLLDAAGEVIQLNNQSVDVIERLGRRELSSEIGAGACLNFKNPFWISKINKCLVDGKIEFVIGELNLICNMKLSTLGGSHIWLALIESEQHEKMVIKSHSEMAQAAKIREMSEIAAGIAHEINNPLTVIYAKTHYLKESLEKNINFEPAAMLSHLDKIHQHSERIFKIVSGMKSLSRDARHDPLVDYSVHKLVNESLSLVNGRIQVLGVKVLQSPIHSDLVIHCWPSLLIQVLVNLFKNAIDSIEKSPFPQLRIDVVAKNNNVLFYVSDSGPGVSAENEAKIFTPFFTTKGVGVGTGIGLSLSAKIVGDHGGTLRLDRSRGNSCFVIDLPVHSRTEKAV